MQKHYDAVIEFMELMGQPANLEPTLQTTRIAQLRYDLILEEINELSDAIDADDYVEIADALADILYVTHGASATFGVGVSTQCLDITMNEPRLGTFGESLLTKKQFIYYLDRVMFALRDDDLTRLRLMLDDIVRLTHETAALHGIDINACFNEVHASNMSKACLTRSDAEASLKMRKQHHDTASKYENAEVHQIGERFILRRSDNHKVLKGQNYFEPDLKQFLRLDEL